MMKLVLLVTISCVPICSSIFTSHLLSSSLIRIDREILENKVVIYSKSYCPYCTKAKALFGELHVPIKVIELDQFDGGKEIQDALLQKTGQRTVPNIFINGQHLGGHDDVLIAKNNGILHQLLNTNDL